MALYHSARRSQVHPIEYAVILATFLFINLFGLELGMSGGVLLSLVSFVYDYARVPVVQVCRRLCRRHDLGINACC